MNRLSEKQYSSALKKIQDDNIYIERNNKLREERNKYKRKFKLPPTSKLMAAYLFIVLNVVLIYAMVCMYKFMDLSYLGVLITDVVGQVLTYFLYNRKSQAENTTGGITYELAMMEKKNELNNTTTLPPSSNEDAVG